MNGIGAYGGGAGRKREAGSADPALKKDLDADGLEGAVVLPMLMGGLGLAEVGERLRLERAAVLRAAEPAGQTLGVEVGQAVGEQAEADGAQGGAQRVLPLDAGVSQGAAGAAGQDAGGGTHPAPGAVPVGREILRRLVDLELVL